MEGTMLGFSYHWRTAAGGEKSSRVQHSAQHIVVGKWAELVGGCVGSWIVGRVYMDKIHKPAVWVWLFWLLVLGCCLE